MADEEKTFYDGHWRTKSAAGTPDPLAAALERIATLEAAVGGVGLSGNPFLDPPAEPDIFDDEFSSGPADLVERGWQIKGWNSNSTLTRAGDTISPWSGPAAGTYRSKRVGSWILIQGAVGDQLVIRKAITLAPGDTYYARFGGPTLMSPAVSGRYSEIGVYAADGGTVVSNANRVHTTVLETTNAANYVQYDFARWTASVPSADSRAAYGGHDIRGVRYESGSSHWPFAANSNGGHTVTLNVTGAPAAATLVWFAIRHNFDAGCPGLLAIDFVRKRSANAWITG